jgi:hypothetical protein
VEELFDIGPDSVRRFFATWYGPPDRVGGIPGAAERLPSPLRAWYEAASSYSTPVMFHNMILDPGEVGEVDGKLVFWLESQEVYEWAADPDDDDPLVYERATVDGEPWHPTGVRLSAFLVSVAVFEAVLGAEHSLHVEDLAKTARDGRLAQLRPMPVPGPTIGAQLYAGDGLLAFVGPHGDAERPLTPSTRWWVYLAATDPERLRTVRA